MEDQQVQQINSISPVAGTIIGIVYLVVMVAMIAGLWKVFAKAGKPGWATLIPIYNVIVLLQIAGKPLWWLLLLCIPFVNFVIILLVAIAIAGRFGKGAGYGIGLTLLPFVFYPMLGFSDATYSEATVQPLQGAGV